MAEGIQSDEPIVPQGVTLRAFDDPRAARAGIYSGTLEALKKRFPLESKSHRLELTNVRYTGPQDFTLAQQKQALLGDKPLHTPVTGHFRLVDKASGAVVDERDEVVMNVPYYTDRGTIINNGSEYTVANQLRLRPGVYTRVRRSGDVETQFNVRPGTGRGFRLRMEPSTGVVTVNVGHANMPLYPLLKTLGVTDQQMIKAWGADVAHANAEKAASVAGRSAIDKLYKAFAGYNATAQDLVSKERYIAETLPKFALDPGVTARTLGIAAEGITPEVLLRAASKMFNVNRGEEQPDDRDNPGFANVYGIEDLYRERIEKDAGKLSRNIMWKLSRAGSLKPLGRAAFSGWHNELLQGSGLAMPGDNSNPMALEEQMMRVTRMGEGGIGSEDVVTDTARQINPGNLNFIDLLAGPENCMPAEAEVMTSTGWVRWDAVTPSTLFACQIDGRLCYCRADELHMYDFDADLYCGKSHALEYRYTPHHRMWCSPLGHKPRFRFEFAKDVHTSSGRLLETGGHQPFVGTYREFFQLPPVDNPGNAYKPIPAIPMADWAAFMGWYLTEGSTRYVPNKVFHVHIAQQKGHCLPVLARVIAAMPFKLYPVYKTVRGKRIQYGYSGSSRQLCEYLRSFGLSYDKYIPEYLLTADIETRKALFSALLLGDGRRKRDTFTFCTVSRRFADTFMRLAFGLGYTTHLRFERDDRAISNTGGTWCVHVLKCDHHQIVNSRQRAQMFKTHYTGKVYCATVPGGLLYCRYGTGLGYWTGNSRIGVDARLGVHARKGSDGKLYSLFLNRQGRKEYVACDKASDSVIGFPNPDPKADLVPAMKGGRVQMVPRGEVDYFVPSMSGLFSSNVNLNPMPTSVQGGRQFYGAKFWGQYMPTVKGEAPLVDSLMPDGKATWSEHYGRQLGTLRAPVDGTVTKVSDKGVTVTDADGKKHFVETVTDFPFNGLTGLTYAPTVKAGDKVAANDMVAASNFVDRKTGGLAMGVNLRMAWLPYKGYSYEDAIVISESAAKKLATDRLYGFEADPRDGVELGLGKYMSAFPKKFTKEQYATLDDNGVVKEGTVLNKGDPISVAVGPKLLTAEDANLGKLSKVLRNAFTDKAQVWDHDYPGTVVSSTMFRGRAKVNVKATPPMQVADKLSPRFALKGVVGQIIPDDKMPRDAVTNEPYDILMNPMGIPSRVAPGQLIETALGKLAKATGRQVRLPQDPPPEGWAKWASDQLAAAGVSPTADVFDPETGKTLHGIGDGYVYFHAMHHLADKKISAKGGFGGYTADLQPAKGGYGGAKRVSGLDTYAILAHGATEVMKDVQTVRGTKNEDWWKAVRSGGPLPAPQVPFVYQKAMNLLRAGGINVVEGQRATDILPMTDADTDKLAGGRIIQNSRMLDDDLKELKGGLFDPYLTGGNANRSRWAAIALPEPIPNPVMEEPVRRLLGLTGKRLQAVLAGEEQLDGLTGGKALQAALSRVDVDREIERQRDLARKSRGSARDNAVKVVGYLSGCKKQGVSPKDWMITKVPVIPPMFRPIAKAGDTALVSDINELYRDVIESADAFRQLRKDVPDSGLSEERLNIYNAVKAAYGLGDPISPEGQAKRLKGAIRQVIGTSPKLGLWQSKVISKAVDGVGRAVITPEPNYDMDQCGIPEDEAWTLYRDYVVRGLRRRGYPEERALQLVEERAKVAKDLLVEEMGRRPVILDRAPTWHKFNFMAFWPSLVEGKTMRMNPVVEKGFTADHDGDTMNFHVPSSDKAVAEAIEKMLPSKNLFSTTDLRSPRYVPMMEMTLGLAKLTAPASRAKPRVFVTARDAIRAYRRGEIGANDPVSVLRA